MKYKVRGFVRNRCLAGERGDELTLFSCGNAHSRFELGDEVEVRLPGAVYAGSLWVSKFVADKMHTELQPPLVQYDRRQKDRGLADAYNSGRWEMAQELAAEEFQRNYEAEERGEPTREELLAEIERLKALLSPPVGVDG